MPFEHLEQIDTTVHKEAAPTQRCCPLFPEEVIACIAYDRAPTAADLVSVARRIGADIRIGSASLFSELPGDQFESVMLRTALIALAGNGILGDGLIEVVRPSLHRLESVSIMRLRASV